MAAAAVLGWSFDYETISARTEAEQLLWHFDAVGRLAKAQTLNAASSCGETVAEQLEEVRFLWPGCLWRALNPLSAADYPKTGGRRGRQGC